jgi:hypothetical protein
MKTLRKEIRLNPLLWLLAFVPVVFAARKLKPATATGYATPCSRWRQGITDLEQRVKNLTTPGAGLAPTGGRGGMCVGPDQQL